MTQSDIYALRALIEKATPGEWWWYQSEHLPIPEPAGTYGPKFNGVGVGEAKDDPDADYKVTAFTGNGPTSESNARLIVALRNAAPALLDAAEQNERLKALLREWLATEMDSMDEEYEPWMAEFMLRVEEELK